MSSTDPWVLRHLPLVPAGGDVLDLAAGNGRHTALALQHGLTVCAVDRNVSGLGDNAAEVLEADLEGEPWPLGQRRFDGIIVCNYLWRPLLPLVKAALAPGGVLIWTTFAAGNERFGRPRNPDFLLQPNELLQMALPDLEVIAFEHGETDDPKAVRQSIVARQIPTGPSRT